MIVSHLVKTNVPNSIANILNKKINRLTILEYVGKENNKYYVKVRCECGEEKIVDVSNILYGTTKSCSCLREEHKRKRFLN